MQVSIYHYSTNGVRNTKGPVESFIRYTHICWLLLQYFPHRNMPFMAIHYILHNIMEGSDSTESYLSMTNKYIPKMKTRSQIHSNLSERQNITFYTIIFIMTKYIWNLLTSIFNSSIVSSTFLLFFTTIISRNLSSCSTENLCY